MVGEELFTLDQAQEKFAKTLNGKTWELLGKSNRTSEEDDMMVLAASASLYHWLQIGTVVNAQRGEWLLARVYTVLGKANLAMEHAAKCQELTRKYPGEMKDFDLFYADEAMARVLALQGRMDEARNFKERSSIQAEKIADPEDKEIVMGDLNAGPWFGLE